MTQPPIQPPATPVVSADALNTPPAAAPKAPSLQTETGTQNQGTASGKPLSLKDKIANFADKTKTDPDAVPDRSDSPPAPTPPAAKPVEEPKDFKTLRTALDQRDVKVSELEAELAKIKPSAEKVTQLEADLAAREQEVTETRQFREKVGLLNSNEFHQRIAGPRQHIAQTIKAELNTDEIDESVWELAQTATSRKQLEDIVDEHIESNILKQQFYTLFFQDVELRKQEEAALAAPAKYLQQTRDAETAQRNQTKEMTSRNFETTWSQSLQDATEMAVKLGENKLIETVELANNPEHNEKVVKPILEAAHTGARAMLQERIELGLPVTREDAARTIYLWRQAIAAQAANMDRMRWFRQAQAHEKTIADLTAKLEQKSARNNPTPGGRPTTGEVNAAPRRGKDLKETIGNFAEQFKRDQQ